MKRIAVLLAIGLLTIGSSFAVSDPSLAKEIKEKLNIDLSRITLDKYEQDYVRVEFKICDGLIQIDSIEGSQIDLINLVIAELEEIHIKTPYSESEVHSFNFTFKKK